MVVNGGQSMNKESKLNKAKLKDIRIMMCSLDEPILIWGLEGMFIPGLTNKSKENSA